MTGSSLTGWLRGPARVTEKIIDRLRVAGDDRKENPREPVGLGSTFLPVPYGDNGQSESRCELLDAKPEASAHLSDITVGTRIVRLPREGADGSIDARFIRTRPSIRRFVMPLLYSSCRFQGQWPWMATVDVAQRVLAGDRRRDQYLPASR